MNSHFLIVLRSIARKIGLTKIVRFFFNSKVYEEKFNDVMLAAIQPGFVVWDVGANIGYYTKKFRDIVTNSGQVVAFEPVPSCFEELSTVFYGDDSTVRCLNLALGENNGTISFAISEDPLSTTNRVVDSGDFSLSNMVQLPIVSGDSLRERENLAIPNLVKIDVEGFEEEVLRGMKNILHSKECSHVFVEVHFFILEQRGKPFAPSNIVGFLKECGFNTLWLDRSHLHAFKTI